MKYIIIPEPVHIVDVGGNPVMDEATRRPALWSLEHFLRSRVGDQTFVNGLGAMDATFLQYAVLDHFKHTDWTPGEVLALEDEHYRRLLDATRAPTTAFNPLFAHSFAPLMRALINAESHPPQPRAV